MSLERSKKTRLILISAPSGAGKTTLCDMLLRDFPEVTLSISTTTRSRRPYETEGVHYFFVSAEEFQRRILAGEFAEWAEVHGNRYGTSKAVIAQALNEGKHVLFDIDVQGAMNLASQYGSRALLIFIHPPSVQVLEQRLTARQSESAASIERRLQNAYNELQSSKSFAYQITNDDLSHAYRDLKTIFERECQ